MSTNELTEHESIEHERTRVPVAGGVLVYESRPDQVGPALIAFEAADGCDTDRSAGA